MTPRQIKNLMHKLTQIAEETNDENTQNAINAVADKLFNKIN